MSPSDRFLTPSEAARRLGVSAKALRVYERRGFISPKRTATGWRVYGPSEMARASEVATLRALGLSLAQISLALKHDEAGDLDQALASHQAALEERALELAATVAKVRELRVDISSGRRPATGGLSRLVRPAADVKVAFDLPWPWGGERFELRDIRALNYIIGPLGSGKTRFAQRLAESFPDAVFVGLERSADGGAAARLRMHADPALEAKVERTLAALVENDAETSVALIAVLVALESEGPSALVIDMVEQGLDQSTQMALIAHLRRRDAGSRPLFLLTRSRAILNLAAVGPNEAIILCPANHSPPTCVAPHPGSPGYEVVASCLASPEVRARTEGVIAWRPEVA